MTNPPPIESDSTVIRVLAVTPIRDDHEALERMLPRPKWILHTAHTVSSAVAELDKCARLPLVLCEANLWPGTWREMLQQLRNMKDPPFLIVASPFADERLWAEALNVGAYDVLAKPFDANEVIRTLSSAWRRWRGQHGQLNEVAGRKAFAALAGESARNEGSPYPISR